MSRRTSIEGPQRSYGDRWWERRPRRRDVLKSLARLVIQLKKVDTKAALIARGKGRVADLVELGSILNEPFTIAGSARTKLTLSDPESIRSALSTLSRDLHLEVQAADGKHPCYLLCRITTGWDAPDTILENLHVSPMRAGLFADSRFIVLMRNGRSRTYLNLAPFRHKLRDSSTGPGSETSVRTTRHDTGLPDDERRDALLEDAATLVIAAAWYEDQRLPFTVADVFGLRRFRWAMEIVGFILGSDLYQVSAGLRDADEDIFYFFQYAHDNPPLARLLKRLRAGGADKTSDLDAAARKAFAKLNSDFSAFLSNKGALHDLEGLELYKIVLGTFDNLEVVAAREHWTPALVEAVCTIEADAAELTQEMLML